MSFKWALYEWEGSDTKDGTDYIAAYRVPVEHYREGLEEYDAELVSPPPYWIPMAVIDMLTDGEYDGDTAVG